MISPFCLEVSGGQSYVGFSAVVKRRHRSLINNAFGETSSFQRALVFLSTVARFGGLIYVGLTATNFKARWRNHQTSFNNEKSKNSTELSKYIWALKSKNERYTIGWKILERAKPYTNLTGKCQLCTTEKHFIITKPELATLNKRNELVSACRHRRKFILRYSIQ